MVDEPEVPVLIDQTVAGVPAGLRDERVEHAHDGLLSPPVSVVRRLQTALVAIACGHGILDPKLDRAAVAADTAEYRWRNHVESKHPAKLICGTLGRVAIVEAGVVLIVAHTEVLLVLVHMAKYSADEGALVFDLESSDSGRAGA